MTHPNDPEWDAQTLANAAAIEADPKRSLAARGSAQRLAETNLAQAEALQGVVSSRPVAPVTGAPVKQVLQSADGRVLPITRSTRR